MTTIPIEYRVTDTGAQKQAEQFRKLAREIGKAAAVSERFTGTEKKQTAAVRKNTAAKKKNTESTNKGTKALANLSRVSSLAIGPLSGVGSRLAAISGVLSTGGIAGLGLIGGIAALAVGLKAVTSRGDSANRSLARIDAIIKATGGAAGVTTKEINQLAIDIGRGTLASVEGVREASAQLLTFRSVGEESFGRTLELAQDLSSLGFGGLSENVIRLGRALEDPEQGLTALRRVGVSVSDSQRDLILTLQRTGQAAKAQAEVLNILAGQVGGAGIADAKNSIAGAFDTATENIGLFFEALDKRSGLSKRIAADLNIVANAIANVIPEDSPQARLKANNRRLQQNAVAEQIGSRGNPTGRTAIFLEETLRDIMLERRAILREIRGEEETAAEAKAVGVGARAQAANDLAQTVARELEDNLGIESSLQRQRDALLEQLESLKLHGVAAERIEAIREAGLEGLRNPADLAAEAEAVKTAEKQAKAAERLLALTVQLNIERLAAQEPLQGEIAALADELEQTRLIDVSLADQAIKEEAIRGLLAAQLEIRQQLAQAQGDEAANTAAAESGLETLGNLDPEAAKRLARQFNEGIAGADGAEARAEIGADIATEIADRLEDRAAAIGEAISGALEGAFGAALNGGSLRDVGLQLGQQLGSAAGDAIGGATGAAFGSTITAGLALTAALTTKADTSSNARASGASAVDSVERVRGIVAGNTSIGIAQVGESIADAFDPLLLVGRRQLVALEQLVALSAGGAGGVAPLPNAASTLADTSESLT